MSFPALLSYLSSSYIAFPAFPAQGAVSFEDLLASVGAALTQVLLRLRRWQRRASQKSDMYS